jgi:hypothetical protein
MLEHVVAEHRVERPTQAVECMLHGGVENLVVGTGGSRRRLGIRLHPHEPLGPFGSELPAHGARPASDVQDPAERAREHRDQVGPLVRVVALVLPLPN